MSLSVYSNYCFSPAIFQSSSVPFSHRNFRHSRPYHTLGAQKLLQNRPCVNCIVTGLKDLSIESALLVSPQPLEGLRSLKATAEDGHAHWLRIDALCTNQVDDAENSIQVPLMSDIYSMAWRVIVWLVKAQSNSSSVMQ